MTVSPSVCARCLASTLVDLTPSHYRPYAAGLMMVASIPLVVWGRRPSILGVGLGAATAGFEGVVKERLTPPNPKGNERSPAAFRGLFDGKACGVTS